MKIILDISKRLAILPLMNTKVDSYKMAKALDVKEALERSAKLILKSEQSKKGPTS